MRIRVIGVLLVALFALPQASSAQFGWFGPLPTFDASNFVQMVTSIRTETTQVLQFEEQMRELHGLSRYRTPPYAGRNGAGARYLESLRPIGGFEDGDEMSPELLALLDRELASLRRGDEVRAFVAEALGKDGVLRPHVERLLRELEFDVSAPQSLRATMAAVAAGGLVRAKQDEAAHDLLRANVELKLDEETRLRDREAFDAERRLLTYRRLTNRNARGPVF